MANRSYLVLSDNAGIYPSSIEPTFSPQEQTLAQGIYCVPLLWLTLFKPGDVRSQDLTVDGESFKGTAPIALKSDSLANLQTALPVLARMFPTLGSLEEYASLLRQDIESIHKNYVTIELAEIADMDDPETFYSHLRYALGSLAGEVPAAVGARSLLKLSEIDPNLPFPSARCLIDGAPTADQQMQHSHLIGCGWERPVSWEPT